MGEENDSVEQAVAERRERLKALRAAQELLNKREEDSASQDGQEKSDNEDAEDNGEQEDNPSMKFRNYVPHDKQLQEAKVAPPTLAKFEDPVAAAPPPSEKEDPLLNIAPKKPNWDLKRDVQKRLEKLDRRTQKAMHKLMVEQEKQKEIAGEEGGEAMEF